MHNFRPQGDPARLRPAIVVVATVSLGLLPLTASGASETVNSWLTTTSDSGGRVVTNGLAPQPGFVFAPASATSTTQTIAVDENTAYQQFEGGGFSMTDSAAWLLGSSGLLSSATRSDVMTKLFSPTLGIGVGFLRNPMGASDLARTVYSYDDMPAGQTDPTLANFSIAHDLVDIAPLTKQAMTINPSLELMASPWSAPGWMKDNGSMINLGNLRPQYYSAYAQYFVKFIQAEAAEGIPVNYVSIQNEPTCCASNHNYPTQNWTPAAMQDFIKNYLYPAFHAAGITTKVLVLDFNWGDYNNLGAPLLADTGVTGDANFGGIAFHGYFPVNPSDYEQQTRTRNAYPFAAEYDTERSGGTWISNQEKQDFEDIVGDLRNGGRSLVKWSLALDQNHQPYNGGCTTCTAPITVHNGDGKNGQVDYTIEYYTMGHLTQFVKPGALRIFSTNSSIVWNVAFTNPDGSKALIAYNDTTSSQTFRVLWGNEQFTATLAARAGATYTWSGTKGAANGTVTSGGVYSVVNQSSGSCGETATVARGAAVQQYKCNPARHQAWQLVATDGGYYAVMSTSGPANAWQVGTSSSSTADGVQVKLGGYSGATNQQWMPVSLGNGFVKLVARHSGKCLTVTGPGNDNGIVLEQDTCTGAVGQGFLLVRQS